MTDRVTDTQLKNMVGFINADIGTESKKIGLDFAYGGVKLVIVHLDQGRAESDLSRRLTKREMYETLHAITNVLRVAKHNTDWTKLKII